MDYKEKYNAVLERANVAHKDEDRHLKATLERIFPELKESGDEKMRESIIYALRNGGFYSSDKTDEAIAWLEKQGKQEPISITDEWIEDYWQHEKIINMDSYDKGEEIQFDHYGFVNFCKRYCKKPVERNEEDESIRKELMDFIYVTCFPVKDLKKKERFLDWLEKQGKQPTDKVEPKFKVGDWVVSNNTGEVWQIGASYTEKGQRLYLYNVNDVIMPITLDALNNVYHLWAIADAKDGDVLVASDGSIFLFAGVDDCACEYYVALTTDNYLKINKEVKGGYWETSRAVYPATKEQRDLLFAKMKEAGYEWNNEKKELKKIESKTLDADKVIEWLRQHSCAACWDNPDEGASQRIEQFKKDFEVC